MAVAIHQISPVAHLPLVLGVVRKLNVAVLIDTFCPPHPAHILLCGRGVEALLLAILDGHHALYKVGARLEERGMLPLLQDGLGRASLNDYRLGQILDTLFAAQLNRVFGAIALNALAVYAISTPWLHQDTTTITLYGAFEEEARPVAGLVPPRPAYGHSKDGRDDLKQVLLSLGVSSDGLPLRMGLRDGNTSDGTETPVAIEECLALGLDGVHGIVADSKAYCKRTLGLCLEQGVGLITLVPRTCAVRQELEAWGQQQETLPLLLEKPGRTRQESPRRWHGRSVVRRVEVEYADGRRAVEDLRFLVVHSSQLAQQVRRYSRRIRNNTSRWNQAFVGSRIPLRSVPYGWRNPYGLRPWPCSRSWGCSCMRSSNGRSACLSATMLNTSPGIKAQRRRPPRPWSSPSLPR